MTDKFEATGPADLLDQVEMVDRHEEYVRGHRCTGYCDPPMPAQGWD